MGASATVLCSPSLASASKWITSPVRASSREAVSSSERAGFASILRSISAETPSAVVAVTVTFPGARAVKIPVASDGNSSGRGRRYCGCASAEP